MTAYVFGAGASKNAGYPLASKMLQGLSDWLDASTSTEAWVSNCRNRIVQIKDTFGSLDDFEMILGKLLEFGYERIKPQGVVTYKQNPCDIVHDCQAKFTGRSDIDLDEPAQGFYPQYLRSDLISAFREYFYQIEELRTQPNAYGTFAAQKLAADSSIITFNYDVALERALGKAGKWDVGTGYGFQFLSGRPESMVKVYKLHGSVNWFKEPINDAPPPVIFTRDLGILGQPDLKDPRVAGNGMGVDNSGSFVLPDPKKSFHWESFWSPLWRAAAANLRAADDVFIHGYSMPPADSRARQLLFENIRKDAGIEVYCRSSSEAIAQQFRDRGFAKAVAFPTIDFETWAQMA